jgi:hypothetical protein
MPLCRIDRRPRPSRGDGVTTWPMCDPADMRHSARVAFAGSGAGREATRSWRWPARCLHRTLHRVIQLRNARPGCDKESQNEEIVPSRQRRCGIERNTTEDRSRASLTVRTGAADSRAAVTGTPIDSVTTGRERGLCERSGTAKFDAAFAQIWDLSTLCYTHPLANRLPPARTGEPHARRQLPDRLALLKLRT